MNSEPQFSKGENLKMKSLITSFKINDNLQLAPIAPENVAEACKSKDARIWLDLQTAEPDEIE